MVKRTLALLSVALVLGVVLVGQAEGEAVVKQNPTSVDVLAPASVSGSVHSGTSDGERLPTLPDIIVSDFLYGCSLQAYWMQCTRHRGQTYGSARIGYGAKSATGGGCELAQKSEQPRVADLEPLPGSLSSASPPGLILRL